MHPLHPWGARLSVAILMLLIAFIGLVLTNIHSSSGWLYWQFAVGVYAALALWLSWYLRRKEETIRPLTIWHECLHWVGVIGSMFLITFFVDQGLLGRIEASLSMLSLVTLAVFLAGVYIESWFLFVGIILGVFAALVAFIEEYLYAFTIPILVFGIVVFGFYAWHKHKKST